MVSMWRLGAFAAVIAAFGAWSTHRAAAQANCQWYGTTALKQQQDNDRMKCGFTGPSWHSDLKMHTAWCASVPPELWREQARKRDLELASCASKAAR